MNFIKADDLRNMRDSEGLLLMGCGGNLQEWVDGINQMLTDESILLENTRFENVSAFEYQNMTCLLFHFDDKVKVDMGKLAVWRIQSYQTFNGTWLSDFIENQLKHSVTEHMDIGNLKY